MFPGAPHILLFILLSFLLLSLLLFLFFYSYDRYGPCFLLLVPFIW